MTDNHFEPAKSIIAKIGGVEAVAKITGRHVSRVYRWMYSREKGGSEGIIPLREAQKILSHANTSNVDISSQDFFLSQQK